MTARFRMAHLTELKAGVGEAKLAEFQRNDTHRHVHAEESSAETGYNTTRVGWFVLGWGVGFGVGFFFPFSSPPSPGEVETTVSAKTFLNAYFCTYSHMQKPYHTISLKL